MQSVLASHLKYDRNDIIILIIILALWDDLLVINSHFSTQHLWVMEATFSLNSFRLILLSLVSTHWCRKSSEARVVGVSATACYSSFLSVPFSSAFLSSSVFRRAFWCPFLLSCHLRILQDFYKIWQRLYGKRGQNYAIIET